MKTRNGEDGDDLRERELGREEGLLPAHGRVARRNDDLDAARRDPPDEEQDDEEHRPDHGAAEREDELVARHHQQAPGAHAALPTGARSSRMSRKYASSSVGSTGSNPSGSVPGRFVDPHAVAPFDEDRLRDAAACGAGRPAPRAVTSPSKTAPASAPRASRGDVSATSRPPRMTREARGRGRRRPPRCGWRAARSARSASSDEDAIEAQAFLGVEAGGGLVDDDQAWGCRRSPGRCRAAGACPPE